MRNEASGPLRHRVEPGIYKRTTKSGQTRWEYSYVDSNGKQRWGTEAKKDEAKKARRRIAAKVDQGEPVAPTKITVAEYAEAWLKRQEARLRPATKTLYRAYLRLHVTPRLGRRKLQSVTVTDIADLIAEMQQGVRFSEKDGITVRTSGKPFAAWTIRGTLVVTGRMFATAVREGVIATNPVTRLEKGERPRVERRQFPELDRDAIGRLIAATPEKYRALVALSVLTGIRQGEALGLRWDDVDVKAGVIRVRLQLSRQGDLVEPKTRAAKRDIPVPPSLAKMLAAHRLASPHSDDGDFVFASETGSPLHHRNLARQGLEKALKATGLPHLAWHDLRHVAASALIAQGADVSYLARVLGHSSPAITLSVYAHAFARIEHDDRARAAMEAAFAEVLG